MNHLHKNIFSYIKSLSVRKILTSSVAATITIGLIAYLSQKTGYSFIIPSFGASCVIIYVTPDSKFSRNRNILLSHILTAFIGVAMSHLVSPYWWILAVATGISILLMQVFDIVHPPAAANPLLIMLQGHTPWTFLVVPVLTGSLLLVLSANIIYWISRHNNSADDISE